MGRVADVWNSLFCSTSHTRPRVSTDKEPDAAVLGSAGGDCLVRLREELAAERIEVLEDGTHVVAGWYLSSTLIESLMDLTSSSKSKFR